jgi:hypothetical protein
MPGSVPIAVPRSLPLRQQQSEYRQMFRPSVSGDI